MLWDRVKEGIVKWDVNLEVKLAVIWDAQRCQGTPQASVMKFAYALYLFVYCLFVADDILVYGHISILPCNST